MFHSQRATAVVVVLAALGSTVWAQDPTPGRAGPSSSDSVKTVFGAGRVVDSQRLDRQRGGVDTTSNTNALDGSVHDNSATQVVTGSNSIADGSFANSAGLPTVIQNTGANVLIQNATIVNVQFK